MTSRRGSVASALVNMTQPLTMTLPWLSQYGGLAKAGKQLAAAARDAGLATRTSILSFDWRTLQVVQREAPEIPTAYLSAQQRYDNVDQLMLEFS